MHGDLSSWLTQIENAHPSVIKLGLERVANAYKQLQCPPFTSKIVTIAGTNGKGTTICALESLLIGAGKSVATYTSPHLFKFNERVRVNGKSIDDQSLIDAFAHIQTHTDESLTYFEYTTLAALVIFAKVQPDVVLLEVGLGGRLDAVNIISPDMAVITSIDYDHQEYLGSTLEEIASEKAGIFRDNIPVVLGASVTQNSVVRAAQKHSVKLFQVTKHFSGLKRFDYLQNNLPKQSVECALAAYTVLKSHVLALPDLHEVASCINNLHLLGRMQRQVINDVEWIFDVAHNKMAAEYLSNQLGHAKRVAVWASAQDKDLNGIIEPLLNKVEHWFIPDLEEKRIHRQKCIDSLKACGAQVNIMPSSFEDIVAKVSQDKTIKEVLVFGSFFTVAAGLKILDFTRE